MGDAVVGREAVGTHIEQLADRYGDFSINQTTMSVPSDGFERARNRGEDGLVDAYVRVWNDDGEAFHLRCEAPFALSPEAADLETRLRDDIERETGVDAVVDDVSRVTIAGIRNEDDPEAPAVYRLFVLFDATYAGDTPEDVDWEADGGTVPEFVSGV